MDISQLQDQVHTHQMTIYHHQREVERLPFFGETKLQLPHFPYGKYRLSSLPFGKYRYYLHVSPLQGEPRTTLFNYNDNSFILTTLFNYNNHYSCLTTTTIFLTTTTANYNYFILTTTAVNYNDSELPYFNYNGSY